MEAIVSTGYKGDVAQGFVPKQKDALKSLGQAIQICDVWAEETMTGRAD
jgi:hypothetical protein